MQVVIWCERTALGGGGGIKIKTLPRGADLGLHKQAALIFSTQSNTQIHDCVEISGLTTDKGDCGTYFVLVLVWKKLL